MFRHSAILAILCFYIISCERITSIKDSRLTFSVDTLRFDTVFSSVGSATRELRIKNRGKHSLIINHLYLAGGAASPFRLNIDGEPASEKYNIQVESGDSIFIFVDLFIDPANRNAPLEVNDSIMFTLNEKNQKVILSAWGQDINLIKNKTIGSATWTKGKPYVVYDNLRVDTLETLTIEAGTRVYFHRNASLIIAGSLTVKGSTELPVIFAGDRLEKMYTDVPGQWKGIQILNSGKGNNISNAIIRNTIFGIQLGEAISSTDIPVLKLFSTAILHSTVSGLSAINGNIEAANCVISHCGSYCIYLEAGGDYAFTNCTLYNSWDYGIRLSSAVTVSEKPEKTNVRVSQLDVNLNNSVIYGDNDSELNIIPLNKVKTGNYYFDHCLIKLDTIKSKFWDADLFPGTIINKNPLFIDAVNLDLRPDTLSPLINKGREIFLSMYPLDIRGISRLLYGKPDIGAYERIPGEHKKEN